MRSEVSIIPYQMLKYVGISYVASPLLVTRESTARTLPSFKMVLNHRIAYLRFLETTSTIIRLEKALIFQGYLDWFLSIFWVQWNNLLSRSWTTSVQCPRGSEERVRILKPSDGGLDPIIVGVCNLIRAGGLASPPTAIARWADIFLSFQLEFEYACIPKHI